MAVEGVTREASVAHHQTLLVRHGQADLHTELVGLECLARADALDLGCVQRVELVLVKALLGADALGLHHQGLQRAQRRRTAGLQRWRIAGLDNVGLGIEFALHLSPHHAQDRAQALDDLLQALECGSSRPTWRRLSTTCAALCAQVRKFITSRTTARRGRWAQPCARLVGGAWPIRSVRHAGGECVGVFRPRALRNARPASHIALHWDGKRISHWYEERSPTLLA